jgi:hypothetical protein
MVKFSNARQRPDVFRIGWDGFLDQLHLRVVPLEGLIVVVLTRRHILEAVGNLFQDGFNALKPLAPVRHSSRLRLQRTIEDAAATAGSFECLRR